MVRNKKFLTILLAVLCLIPYGLYLYIGLTNNQGPVDFDTFLGIGQRLLSGEEVYTTNSYYPIPYTFIFAILSLLPRQISFFLWLLIPVLIILMITDWEPRSLLFAPTFSHFLGGQSSVFSLIGFWGYRKNQNPENIPGGLWLALLTLKPQLGIIPVLWAAYSWWQYFRAEKKIPKQFLSFLSLTLAFYLPSFAVDPKWPIKWLSQPRPLFERALSGIAPRTLLILSSNLIFFWTFLFLIAASLLWALWKHQKDEMNLDVLMLWGAIVNPLIHDYDLVQLVPIIHSRQLWRFALLASTPGWLVILFAYDQDPAWFAFTLIAPTILWAYFRQTV
jgi:hypothetical protein